MKSIHWDPAKNEMLKAERGVSFEEIEVCIQNQQVLAITENPSKKYKDQWMFIVSLNNYIYYVPFAKAGEDIFLKTIIPSRKLKKMYLDQGGENNESA